MIHRIINTLSIDISLGAIIVACFFCVVFGVPFDWASLVVLGLCVWIIYTMDHLLDANKIGSHAVTFRHQFHQHNFKIFIGTLVFIGIITIILITNFLDPTMIVFGLGLGVVALVYLVCQRFLSFIKEVIGAVLYTLGILIPAISRSSFILSYSKFFLILQFFLVVLMNLILFSGFDKKNDELNQQSSIATRFGSATTNRLVWIVFLLAIAFSMVNIFYFNEYPIPSSIILSMTFLLAVIQFFPTYFSQHDRFRYVGDGIFFLPLLYFLF